jgi:hypothetical protein
MSKLTQIENELRALDGAKFQQLCDLYLHRRGYEGINPLGRVVGADKVSRGTPDTWIPQPNGKYVFAEYTTQREGVFEKLRRDLAKCVDESRTGIPVDKIQELILCHTSVLEPRDEDVLIGEAEALGVLLTLIGIGPLAHDLYQKYPLIARDMLGVEVDTGQVLLPEEFVALIGTNALATPLDTEFHFREEELTKVVQLLGSSDLVIVSGRSGVGKTRLALECVQSFVEAHQEYNIRCIYNRGADLFQDLLVHFSVGSYVVLVDDANRLSGFDYVLQLLRERRADLKIKVVATVRDYVLQKVRDAVRPYGGGVEVELHSLSDDQIKELIKDVYDIHHGLYLDRIADIAHGNPRLAVMAARVAARENTLSSIRDVSVLYDEYYSTIRQDLDSLADRVLLRTAGIVAFFRTVDRSNGEQMERIATAFGVSPEVFWSAAERLHDMELLDMWEEEVVKVSDQVLATYLFYLVFFKDRGVLDFSALLKHFFPQQRHRLLDALNPVINAFGSESLFERLRPTVERAWAEAEEAGDENRLLHLIDDFWYIQPAEALAFAHRQIAVMDVEERVELNFRYRNYPRAMPQPSVLSILGSFRNAVAEELRIAIDLLLDYTAKRPSDLPHVLSLLIEYYGFQHTSRFEGYGVERTVIDTLVERISQSDDPLFAKIFLVVGETFLHMHFDSTRAKRASSFVIYRFDLASTEDLLELRHVIWQQLFSLYQHGESTDALKVLEAYASGFNHIVKEIVEDDAHQLIPFISTHLDPNDYTHDKFVQSYVRRLERLQIPVDPELGERFQSELHTLSELLNPDIHTRYEIGWKEYDQWRQERIKEHFAGYSLADFTRFFDAVTTLFNAAPDDNTSFQIRHSVETVLLVLAARDPELFARVLQIYLATGNPLLLAEFPLVNQLVNRYGSERAYGVLSEAQYQRKRRWLIAYHEALPVAEISEKSLAELYDLYREGSGVDLPYDFSYLKKYSTIDPLVIIRLVEIVVGKASSDGTAAQSLEHLLSSHSELGKELSTLFSEHIPLLKQVYLAAHGARQHVDYDGSVFNTILDLDANFACEYIEWVFESHVPRYIGEAPDPAHDHRNYDFIWRRDDYAAVMEQVSTRLFQLESGKIMYRSYLQVFFAVREEDLEETGRETTESIASRQDRLLANLIERRNSHSDFMRWLFELISRLPTDRRRSLLAVFIEHNRSFDDFGKLALEPNMFMAQGSWVPVYQRRIEYLESLLPLFNRSELLRHRLRVERKIQNYRSRMKEEERSDFMER